MFDPLQLTPDCGVNRVVLRAVAGVDNDLVGHRAIDLLSAAALDGVDIDETSRRLAGLIATLFDRATAAEQGDTPTRAALLAHWRTVKEVYLGGGVAAALGDGLAPAAQLRLQAALTDPPRLRMPSHPATLALEGLARTPGVAAGDLLFDFGHTAVKRGVAGFEGTAAPVRLLPSIGVPDIEPEASPDFVAEMIAATIRALPAGATKTGAHLSLATYITRGVPAAIWSLYTGLGPDIVATIKERLGDRGVHVDRLSVHHDGTAAARAVAGAPVRAVVMMGTSLGIGFAPRERPGAQGD